MAALNDDDETPADPPLLTVEDWLVRIEKQQRRILGSNRLTIEALWRIESVLADAIRPPWPVRVWRWLRRGLRAG
jgi:hypothetical protein